MALENVKCYTLRLNLDNEQHRRVYELIENLNPDIYKSKNQYFVDRIDPLNGRSLDEVEGTVVHNEKMFLNDIKDITENAVIRILGNFYSGNGVKALVDSEISSSEKDTSSTETGADKGITNPEISDVMNSWYED